MAKMAPITQANPTVEEMSRDFGLHMFNVTRAEHKLEEWLA